MFPTANFKSKQIGRSEISLFYSFMQTCSLLLHANYHQNMLHICSILSNNLIFFFKMNLLYSFVFILNTSANTITLITLSAYISFSSYSKLVPCNSVTCQALGSGQLYPEGYFAKYLFRLKISIWERKIWQLPCDFYSRDTKNVGLHLLLGPRSASDQ